jgi:2-polyprenyl-3-methyl-5-hydroxy-6-metoxy-1,4-benzoquinol methylase
VLAINEVEGEVAHVDWTEHGEQLVERGPFDLVLAADVLYTGANVDAALRLFPRLVAPDGSFVLADPNRNGAQRFLAGARGFFELVSERGRDVSLHTLTPRNG